MVIIVLNSLIVFFIFFSLSCYYLPELGRLLIEGNPQIIRKGEWEINANKDIDEESDLDLQNNEEWG